MVAVPSSVSSPTRRHGQSILGVVAYLVGLVILLVIVSKIYLIPALRAVPTADPGGRRELGAVAWLMLSLVLLYMILGMMLTVRFGRLFFPRNREPRVKTQYVDAWAESAKRLNAKPDEEEK
jgi:formate hydrogenlyase subunit 3/multisubunit Na+/H+ antiporter MnhD subunit